MTTIERREFLIKSSAMAAAVPTALACRSTAAQAQKSVTDLTAVAAVAAMRHGDVKAEDYARALLDRAQALETLNAFRTLDRELVLEAGLMSAEDLDADRVALQPLAAAGQRLLDDEAQKIGRPSGLLETAAREDSLERGAHFARARFTGLVARTSSGGVVAATSAVGHAFSSPGSIARRDSLKFFSLYELKVRA